MNIALADFKKMLGYVKGDTVEDIRALSYPFSACRSWDFPHFVILVVPVNCPDLYRALFYMPLLPVLLHFRPSGQ